MATANHSAFKLPLQFEPAALLQDLQVALREEWGQHYNTNDFSGSWNSIALYSASGNTTDIFALPSDVFKPTPLLQQCPYFKQLLDNLLFEKETVRLLRLAPGSEIHPHRDRGLAYRYNCFRLHIPIITEAAVEFIVDGQHLQMSPGECWYADFDKPHAVYNKSNGERVHLVIDGKRNAWTDTLFISAGYDREADAAQDAYDAETQKRIREELERMGTDGAKTVLRSMNKENHAG
jgi:quercetin dioxygenase-like cupin family protein